VNTFPGLKLLRARGG